MIGVISEHKRSIIDEFFQLFKTPWEFYQKGHLYDVILTTESDLPDTDARCVLVFGSHQKLFDRHNGISLGPKRKGVLLQYDKEVFPIYGEVASFLTEGTPILTIHKEGGDAIGILHPNRKQQCFRIGYDIFSEVSFLLSVGQPPEFAQTPTLDIHILMIRNLILNSGVTLIEIPSAPRNHNFIVCLTHDVDFVGIRKHLFDHTMFGFLYRATVGGVIGLIQKKINWWKVVANLKAAFLLPFVYLGLARDFWIKFDEYINIEQGLGATFFFLPYSNRPGDAANGKCPKRRASKYHISDSKAHVAKLMHAKCEIGLHGIDAWNNVKKGIEEFKKISQMTGTAPRGNRMHWLFFDSDSPAKLEKIGFLYDSTCGYNEAAGFKAGTARAFRPPSAQSLLELPLQIQDTALFYSGRMGLREKSAFELCKKIVASNAKYGGVLVINWHHRSLAPERLWGNFYRKLLKYLQIHRAWFATCSEAAKWFEKRREARFEVSSAGGENLKVRIYLREDRSSPDLRLRVYSPPAADLKGHGLVADQDNNFTDFPITGDSQINIDRKLGRPETNLSAKNKLKGAAELPSAMIFVERTLNNMN